ncbi:MAG: bifunctional diguanylate cyclase/phosphodiesterase [Acidimicrobiales bacterium]
MLDTEDTGQRPESSIPVRPNEIDRLRGAALFAHSGDAIVDLNPAGVIAGFNPAAEQLFGYSAAAVLGQPAGVLLPGRARDEVAALLADLASRQDVEPYITDYRRPDGDVLQLSVTAVPLVYPEDRAAGLTVIARDLTPLRVAMAELAARDSRYRTMVETTHEGIAIVDTNFQVSFANARLADMVGYGTDRLVGNSARAFLFPEDLPKVLEMVARRRQGISEGNELRLRHRDGTAVWALIESSPIPDETGQAQSLVMFTNITGRKAAELALREREALFRGHFEHVAVGIARSRLDGTLLEVNPAMCRITGYVADDLVGRSITDFIHPEDREASTKTVRRVSVGVDGWAEFGTRCIHRDGHVLHVHITLSVVPGPDGAPGYLAAVVQDVTEAVVALDSLRRSEETLRLLADNAQDLIFRYRFGPQPGFDYASPALESLYGYRLEDFPADSDPMRQLLGETQAEAVLAALSSGHASVAPLTVKIAHKDGREIWSEARASAIVDDTGQMVGIEAIVRDISERKAVEDQLAHQALHDPLTGLANRALLSDRIAQALARLERQDGVAAVLFLDLDGFKLVNDSLGHALGDELLKRVADRLRAAARSADSVARLGGDEFVVLCENLFDATEAMPLAERLLQGLATPFDIDGHQLFVSASIGVATSPAGDPDAILRDADAAMYQAKKSGRNRCAAFTASLHEQTSRRLRLASELHGALERGEFRLHYQPLLSLESGEVTALEALLRWQHPAEGLLLPDEFITVAEDAGLIADIGAWVLIEACADAARWARHRSDLSICVNVSAHQLADELIGQVTAALSGSGLSASRLVLEVTESAVMANAKAGILVLKRVRDLGVRISVDDFGTGYSSLAYLQQLPVDELKIDRAFIQRLAGTGADTAIVTSIIDLAHAIGLHAVAEGVETVAQASAVRTLGCDSGQGYLWSQPVGPESVPALLRNLRDPEMSGSRSSQSRSG